MRAWLIFQGDSCTAAAVLYTHLILLLTPLFPVSSTSLHITVDPYSYCRAWAELVDDTATTKDKKNASNVV